MKGVTRRVVGQFVSLNDGQLSYRRTRRAAEKRVQRTFRAVLPFASTKESSNA